VAEQIRIEGNVTTDTKTLTAEKEGGRGGMNDQQQFDEWAILELFGHQRLAGRVTAVNLGGVAFIRVDVPDAAGKKKNVEPILTKFLSPFAIYSIVPVTEATARAAAKSCANDPITRWDVQELIDKAADARVKRLTVDGAPFQGAAEEDIPEGYAE
jgi:hypothetical protein